MQVGTFVEARPGQFYGIDLEPMRGWVVAMEGDWLVVRISSMRHPQAPFGTFHRRELTEVPEIELVRRGATLLT